LDEPESFFDAVLDSPLDDEDDESLFVDSDFVSAPDSFFDSDFDSEARFEPRLSVE